MKLDQLHESKATDLFKGMAAGALIGAGALGGLHHTHQKYQTPTTHAEKPSEGPRKPEQPQIPPKVEKPNETHAEPQETPPETPQTRKSGFDYQAAAKYLYGHEGIRTKVYDDGVGNPTIGIGHAFGPESRQIFNTVFGNEVNYNNIISGRDALTNEQIWRLFEYDLERHLTRARNRFHNFDDFPSYLQLALLDSVYRGDTGPRTTALINAGKWREAAVEYLNRRDYRDRAKNNMRGIGPRMERNRDAMLRYANELGT